MSEHDRAGEERSGGGGSFLRSRYGIGLIVFLAIGAYLVTTEHRPHLFAALPWLLPLACPLLHLLMHGGHGEWHDHTQGDAGGPKP
jgi:hypothetical protein